MNQEKQRVEIPKRQAECLGPGGLVLTREELATALRVSVRTVDRMVAAEEIPVMDLGEDLVRFYLPDVLEALRSGNVKFGRKAAQPQGAGKSEVRNSKPEGAEGDHQSHEPHEREH